MYLRGSPFQRKPREISKGHWVLRVSSTDTSQDQQLGTRWTGAEEQGWGCGGSHASGEGHVGPMLALDKALDKCSSLSQDTPQKAASQSAVKKGDIGPILPLPRSPT